MQIGVVGKPNVGKSTLFKALTLADVLIANYPFATIEPNTGFGHVKIDCVDTFFNVQCTPRFGYCESHKRFIPVEIIDVAGLVPGAHEGKGMGNKFLDDLRQADALIHVIDCSGSTNEKGEPVSVGSYNPADDIKFLEEELDQWYNAILIKGWGKFSRAVQQEGRDISKALAKQLSGLGVSAEMIKSSLNHLALDADNPASWNDKELFALARQLRKKTKKMIIAANKIDVRGAEENLKRLKEQFPETIIIGCSAESELALKEASKRGLIKYTPGESSFELMGDISEQQHKALSFIKESVLNKFGSTGVQQIINEVVFKLLKYLPIFPGGVNNLKDSEGRILPDCFLMPLESTALDFAYKLHTDFGKNFIKAIDVKTRMVIGKEHKLKYGDVIEIVSRH